MTKRTRWKRGSYYSERAVTREGLRVELAGRADDPRAWAVITDCPGRMEIRYFRGRQPAERWYERMLVKLRFKEYGEDELAEE